jgi:putative nucleotidyltransferase with HDIG domain
MIEGEKFPTYAVPACSYVVSECKNEIINAYLGTCTGLVLCDKTANVGGLIHILLPEPNGEDIFGRPENYALTGLPIFIRDLCNKGADVTRLEATIAGGAFVGELSRRDVDLDIGGRTVEIIEKILHKNGIQIRKRETGGYFSCRLNLNLRTMESSIEPIIDPPSIDIIDFDRPTPEQLKAAIEKVCSIPQIILKIIRMIKDQRYSFEDLGKEVREDQVISGKILKVCNSAYFHNRTRVDSIDRALVLLGEKQLLQVIMSAAFEDFFSSNGKGYSLCRGGLFNHAIGTALMSEQLSLMTASVSPDIAYSAGLLHDIGKVVLDQYMNRAYPLFYRRTQMDGENLFLAEREAFGITHDEVGGMLAEQWSLPENLTDAIINHHNPLETGKKEDLTNIIYIADLLMSRFLIGQELEMLDTANLSKSLKTLGFEKDQFLNIVEKIPSQIFHLPAKHGYFTQASVH